MLGTSTEVPQSHASPDFLDHVQPLMVLDDEAVLCDELRRNWPDRRLIPLLAGKDAELVRMAALCLGLTGGPEAVEPLSRVLHHDDYFVVSAAERAMWSIWFRASTESCGRRLKRAVARFQAGDTDHAEQLIERIIADDPDFAEAYNQRAVLRYLTARFEHSLMDCYKTQALNPHHFGAAAGIGHNLMQLGDYRAAATAYRQVLDIHPRMEGIRQALRKARELANTIS